MSEISPDNVRSRLVSFFMLGGLCGSLIAYLTDYAFSPFHEWWWMFGLGAIPAVSIGMLFLPESPRWLANHVLVDKARTVLRRIRGSTWRVS
ncbi:MAG: MFS transporter [Candidatus Binatia bacterium]